MHVTHTYVHNSSQIYLLEGMLIKINKKQICESFKCWYWYYSRVVSNAESRHVGMPASNQHVKTVVTHEIKQTMQRVTKYNNK